MDFFRKIFHLKSLHDSKLVKVDKNKATAVFGRDNIKSVMLPSNVVMIDDRCFHDCIHLQNVVFPKKLKIIGNEAFKNCFLLKKIKFPKQLGSIGYRAFENCYNLEEVILPNSITHLGLDCFEDCHNIKKIKLPKYADNFLWIPLNLPYLCKIKNEFYLQKNPSKDSICLPDSRMVRYCLKNWGNKDFKKNINYLNKVPFELFDYFYENAQGYKEINFVQNILNSNIKKYIWLRNRVIEHVSVMEPLVGICEILGVFEKTPLTISRVSKSKKPITEKIDYAQKATEFLYQKIKDNKLDLVYAKMVTYYKFKNKVKSFKFHPQFADFVFKNFDEIMKEGCDFFIECYNRFDEMQRAHTTNKGGCRQLAPTVEFFKQYLDTHKFAGITKENQEVANVIGKFYSKQSTFDAALNVIKISTKKHIPASILKKDFKGDIALLKHSKKPQTTFDKTYAQLDEIIKDINETNFDLVDIANKHFSYELLRKDNAINLVLGKLCGCCAHIEGIGAGIAFAPMLHPDVQNLVIKNDKGDIIAKTTMYVNRKEGYAICNTFELNERANISQRDDIYLAFKTAINAFAEQYNKENDIKLKIINVGMNFNDLHDKITHTDKKAKFLLEPIDYSQFSLKFDRNYQGDSFDNQYTLWEIDKDKTF